MARPPTTMFVSSIRKLQMVAGALVAFSTAFQAVTAESALIQICLGLGSALVAGLTIRSWLAYAIEFGEDEVVLHEALRKRRIRWDRIVDVGVTRLRRSFVLYPDKPYFELDDGSVVKAKEIRGPVVQEVVAEARSRLTMHSD